MIWGYVVVGLLLKRNASESHGQRKGRSKEQDPSLLHE